MMKVGILGCGGMGTTHCLALKGVSKHYDLEVTALADCRTPYLEKAAAYWPEAQTYEYGMDLLEQEELDAVHICLPSYLHTDHAIKAMRKGVHVFIEKPVCLTMEECERLLEARKSAKGSIFVGQVVRFFDEYNYIKEIYQDKIFGNLEAINLQRLSGDVTWGFEDWFHKEEKSGTVITDLHVHDIDFLRYLLGEPDHIDDVMVREDKNGLIHHVLTSYRFGSVTATAEGMWDISAKLPFEAAFRAYFEKATVVYNSKNSPPLVVYKQDGTVHMPVFEREFEKEDKIAGINISDIGPYYTEIKYFVESVLKGEEPVKADLGEGIASVQLALKELKIAKNNFNKGKEEKG